MVAFPIVKLASLAIRQISKPLAKLIQNRAKAHPIFRRFVCMPPAQLYHWADVNIRMRMLGLGKVKEVQPLSEEMAVDLGGELLGESIIFIVAAAMVFYEYRRSGVKEQLKESAKESQLLELQETVMDLELSLEQQSAVLREIQRTIGHLDTRISKR